MLRCAEVSAVCPQLLRVYLMSASLVLGSCLRSLTSTAAVPVQAGWHLHLCCCAGCGHRGCCRQSPGEPAALTDVLADGACRLNGTNALPGISSCKLEGCRPKRRLVNHPGCSVSKGSHDKQVHKWVPDVLIRQSKRGPACCSQTTSLAAEHPQGKLPSGGHQPHLGHGLEQPDCPLAAPNCHQ